MKQSNSRFPWLFLILGFAISWAVWIPVGFTGRDYQSSPYLLAAVLVDAFGPGLAATLLNTIGNLSFDIFAYAPGTLKHLIYISLMMLVADAVLYYFQITEKKTQPQIAT